MNEARPRASRGAGSARRGGTSALAALALALTVGWPAASAGVEVLRRAGASGPTVVDPATIQAAAAAAAQASAAAAQVRQADSALRRALDAVKAWQALQASARAAALAGPSTVPNGTAAGALVTVAGATPGSADWQGAMLPAASSGAQGRTAVTVTQTAPKAILTWTTFNVGRETDLSFDQSAGGDSASSWVALNRVVDPSAAPSRILGSIKAQGQVYLVNRNGIIFGGASQVSVGSLLASGIDFAGATAADRNKTFLQGLAQASTVPVKVLDGGGGAVSVEAGAALAAAPYGQLLLVGAGGDAGGVRNAGALAAPDGQVLLAAGNAVSLLRSTDNRRFAMPGLDAAGVVENAAAGFISTPRGDISLDGSEVRQAGLLTATTGAKASGSLHVGAADAPPVSVSFEGGGITQILPDIGGEKAVGTTDLGVNATSGTDSRSRMEVYGQRILLRDGSTLYAPAGNVVLSAILPLAARQQASLPADGTRIYLESGSTLDVSGLRDVKVAMETNSIQAELRASELRDNPVARDGPLRSRSVYFDARKTVSVADLSGYAALVERDIQQLMTKGGSLALAANEVVARRGSVIDLSGGSLRYLDGTVRSTRLIDPTGQLVAIEDAKPGVAYLGVEGDFLAAHARWGLTDRYVSGLTRTRPRLEQGYLKGSDAGSLTVDTNDAIVPVTDINKVLTPQANPSATGAFRVFDGAVRAATVVGPRQLEAPPALASLTLLRSADVTFSAGGRLLADDFGPDGAIPEALRNQHVLPTSWFDGATFGRLTVQSGFWADRTSDIPTGSHNLAPGGHLTIAQGTNVNLGTGGALSFAGKQAQIDGEILGPGGTVTIRTLQQPQAGADGTVAGDPVGTTVVTGIIDIAGRWTNDRLATGTLPGALKGGSVTLTAQTLRLAEGSVIDASGGARLTSSGSVKAGAGGSITLDVSQPTLPGAAARGPVDGHLELAGTLEGYSLGTGGTLQIITPLDLFVGSTLPAGAAGTARLFTPAFFTQGGFASYSIVGERGLTVTAGTAVAPLVESLSLPGGLSGLPTGAAPLSILAGRQVLQGDLRPAVKLALSTAPARSVDDSGSGTQPGGDLTVEAGASVSLPPDPGSSLRLAAAGTLFVDGTVSVPGGTIALVGDDLGLNHPLGAASVRLGPNARLLSPGFTRVTPDGPYLRHSVLGAGTISLSAAYDLEVDQAAVVDVSGVQGRADLVAGDGQARYLQSQVGGAAGSVVISANTGTVGGVYRLQPGADGAAGGRVSVAATFARGATFGGTLVVRQRLADGTPTVTRTSATPQDQAGELVVAAQGLDLASSGLDDLTLASQPGVPTLFDGDVALHARGSLSVLARVVGARPGAAGQVALTSRYLLLDGGAQDVPGEQRVTDLGGSLRLTADLIDVAAAVSLGCNTFGCAASGFKSTSLVSTTDIRLSDHDASGRSSLRPRLIAGDTLDLTAAQVYVASRLQAGAASTAQGLERAADDPGFLLRADGAITVHGNGGPAPVPLSFGERLTLQAQTITQGGVLRAPQGQIRLLARAVDGTPAGSVTLLPGSLTSVSLEGSTVPFGAVQADGSFLGYTGGGQVPTKSIQVDAPTIAVKGGAVVDVSGGGDLLGYAFRAGNGGSTDILASVGAFAILPALGTAPAPVGGEPGLMVGSIKPGDVVWLQGVPGLSEGYYTRLPAHDALLSGALLVQPLGGAYATAPATSTRPDGAAVAAGWLGTQVAGGEVARSPGFATFAVSTQPAFLRYSQLDRYTFAAAASALAQEGGLQVRTPADAGAVSLAATTALTLDGTGRFGAGATALQGLLDVAAPKIAVGKAPDPSYLALTVAALEGFGAGSVLLGGTRSAAATGTSVAVVASEVVVDTSGGAAWTGPDLLLAATGRVQIAAGSSVQATGTIFRDASPLLLSGDGAMVHLTTGARAPIVRSGTAGRAGQIDLAQAILSASGSLSLDASAGLSIASGTELGAAQLDLASARVNLGDAPAGTPGTTLGSEALGRLSTAKDLLLRASGSIEIYGRMTLGSRAGGVASLGALTLDTPLVQGHGAAGETVAVAAGALTLRNGGAAAAAGTGGPAALALDVDRLILGPGQVALAGLSSVQGRAGEVVLQGQGGLQSASGLQLAIGRLTAAAGARTTIDVAGELALSKDPATVASPAAAGLGATLSLAGGSVSVDTSVALPAGRLEATARTGALLVGGHGAIDLRGAAVDFAGQTRVAPGGSVRLAAAGDLELAAGSSVDVSVATAGGDAGQVELTSGGQARLLGTLSGQAGSGGHGGSLRLDAVTLQDPAATLGALQAGGFDAAQALRIRQGDLTVAAAQTVRAREVVLQADAGRVAVAGTVATGATAAHPDGGTIRLVGGTGVAIAATARLDAHAEAAASGAFDPASGSIEIAAAGGRVDVAPGATVELGGGRGGGGSLVVRAPRDGADVAIDRLGAEVRGARSVAVQGARDYLPAATGGVATVGSSLAGQALADAMSWLGGQTAIRTRLGRPDLLVGAGIRVTTPGDLLVQADLPVNGALGAGYVGLVAGGRLEVRGAVSDGFTGADRAAALLRTPSSTIELEAGTDLVLQPGALVRTGTGRLSLTAGRDLVFADPKASGDPSVSALPAAVAYTAGRRTDLPASFHGAPATLPLGDFPTDGGGVELVAGRDVLAPGARQTTSAWLFRYGATSWGTTTTAGDTSTATVDQQASWSIVYRNFEQAVGALGGGDVAVRAGRDVSQLQVAIPTTGYLTTLEGSVPTAADLHVQGGGDLALSAGRDLLGGLFVLGRGRGELSAGGLVGPTASGGPGLLVGLMDATASIRAGSDLRLEAVFDPMRQGQIGENLRGGTAGSAFWGYSGRAALDATSLAGDFVYENNPWASVRLTDASNQADPRYQVTMNGTGDTSLYVMFARAAPTLRATALTGSIDLGDAGRARGSLFLAPASSGTLEALAAQDLRLLLVSLNMDDVADRYARGPLDAFATFRQGAAEMGDVGNWIKDATTNQLRGFTPLHAADASPVRLVALQGSICAYQSGACLSTLRQPVALVSLPKPLALLAGRDVVAGVYQPQNNRPDDLTTLQAGRDIRDVALQVAGVGSTVVDAGRNVSQELYGKALVESPAGGSMLAIGDGSKNGLVPNLALPHGQASNLVVLAGTSGGMDLDGFAVSYLDPTNAKGVAKTYLAELADLMKGLGRVGLSTADLLAAFQGLPRGQQEVFLVEKVYFPELRASGIEYNDSTSANYRKYDRGDQVIKSLFPATLKDAPAEVKGNIVLAGKPVETWAHGNVALVAPYGRIDVGNPSVDTSTIGGGVVTRRGGDVLAMADQDISLYTSRLFTLQGGDVTMWTSNGSITAGSGSKTVVTDVPLSYTMSNDAVVTVNVFGLQTGSGIGVLDALQGSGTRPRSRLDLIAPKGEVNAGDAGIRVVGDLNIAALTVVGVENIQASGASVGVPKVETPNLGALTAASQAAGASAQEAAGPASPAAPKNTLAELPSIVTVEVVGYETPAKPEGAGEAERKEKKKKKP